MELDEQSKRLLEYLKELSLQELKEFYIALFEPDDEYDAMMQDMGDGHWKRGLVELRKIAHEESALASPNYEQSKDAQSTTVNGCCGYCTTESARKQ